MNTTPAPAGTTLDTYQRRAVAGPFRTFALGGGPGGLPHFLEHLGPSLQSLWDDLGTPTFDEPTVRLLSQQAVSDVLIDTLAAQRDQAQIKVMHALGETPHDAST
ncbi:hypothetical protein ACFVT1_35375 [Streptomyces sp. NPDC057963]|uniref:hypothetical protein n=1 Tax=Streptomyces sp. NPDC057963 TaxID=3346290 RepID=UPI0036E58C51